MAGLAEVETALVDRIGAAVIGPGYLAGADTMAATGSKVRVYRGWPVASVLDADIAAGTCHVSVFAQPGMTRDMSRYRPEWQAAGTAAPTLTASVFANKVTFAGTACDGVAAVTWGGVAYTAALDANSTPPGVAAAFAALIPGATASGAVLTLGNDVVKATVVANQAVRRELRRQVQGIVVTVWADTPAKRDALADAADVALAAIPNGDGVTQFLTLASGERARVQYRGARDVDTTGKARIWRRDLTCMVEFATTEQATQPVMAAGAVGVRAGGISTGAGYRDRQLIGAIRYDAWYSGDALTLAEAAALSPAQFNYRAPFFAAVSGGVSLDGNHQAVMDAECAAAVTARLDYWAFLGWPSGAAELNARTLYLASTAAKPNFCLVTIFSNLGYQGALQPEFADIVTLSAHARYQRVMGRPLMFFFATADSDIATRYGSHAGLGAVIAKLRSQVAASAGANPYMVVQDPSPERAARLCRACGFDAVGAYALPGGLVGATSYAALASRAASAWDDFARFGLDVVPPAMTGWNTLPRVVTPSAYFGDEVSGSPSDYAQDGTASAIAAHVAAMRAWLRRNPGASPMQAGLVYAWNEFTEGGWLCPTWVSGQPAGDLSRVTALGAALS